MASSSAMEILPVKTPKMAWNVVPSPPTPSFQQVMIEEEELSKSSLNDKKWSTEELELAAMTPAMSDPECENDMILAQILQAQFDKEHNKLLAIEEKKYNRSNKVHVSFEKYRRTAAVIDSDDDDDDLKDCKQDTHLQHFDELAECLAENKVPTFGKKGFCKRQDQIVTKHDPAICEWHNARRVMEFRPGFETGYGCELQLPNRVFNQLKVFSKTEKKQKRIHDKMEKSTSAKGLDAKTRLIIFKLVENDVLNSIHGSISTGKESVVFHSFGGKTPELKVPDECAIKVFKTVLNEFKTRAKYINDDFRFKDGFRAKNSRRVVHMWAEKEFSNLKRLKMGGIPCPEAVILKKHVLVMSFIGSDKIPALKLKDAQLNVEQMNNVYEKIVEIMKKMYSECKLVHADLSEFNILWHDNGPWIIDVSQAVDINHPQALTFLLRDCTNVCMFFSKHGMSQVATPQKLFAEITGMNVPAGDGTELLCNVNDFERNLELITFGKTDKPYPFDAVFKEGDDAVTQE